MKAHSDHIDSILQTISEMIEKEKNHPLRKTLGDDEALIQEARTLISDDLSQQEDILTNIQKLYEYGLLTLDNYKEVLLNQDMNKTCKERMDIASPSNTKDKNLETPVQKAQRLCQLRWNYACLLAEKELSRMYDDAKTYQSQQESPLYYIYDFACKIRAAIAQMENTHETGMTAFGRWGWLAKPPRTFGADVFRSNNRGLVRSHVFYEILSHYCDESKKAYSSEGAIIKSESNNKEIKLSENQKLTFDKVVLDGEDKMLLVKREAPDSHRDKTPPETDYWSPYIRQDISIEISDQIPKEGEKLDISLEYMSQFDPLLTQKNFEKMDQRYLHPLLSKIKNKEYNDETFLKDLSKLTYYLLLCYPLRRGSCAVTQWQVRALCQHYFSPHDIQIGDIKLGKTKSTPFDIFAYFTFDEESYADAFTQALLPVLQNARFKMNDGIEDNKTSLKINPDEKSIRALNNETRPLVRWRAYWAYLYRNYDLHDNAKTELLGTAKSQYESEEEWNHFIEMHIDTLTERYVGLIDNLDVWVKYADTHLGHNMPLFFRFLDKYCFPKCEAYTESSFVDKSLKSLLEFVKQRTEPDSSEDPDRWSEFKKLYLEKHPEAREEFPHLFGAPGLLTQRGGSLFSESHGTIADVKPPPSSSSHREKKP